MLYMEVFMNKYKKITFILMVAVVLAIISSPNASRRIIKHIRMAAGRGINAILLNKWTVCASVFLVAIVHIAVMAVTALVFGWSAGKILTVKFGDWGFAAGLGMYPASFHIMVQILLKMRERAAMCQNPALKQLILETVKTWGDGYECTSRLFKKINKSKFYIYIVPSIIKMPYEMWLEQLGKLA